MNDRIFAGKSKGRQRDFFGARTYERTDKPAGEFFHTNWPDVVTD